MMSLNLAQGDDVLLLFIRMSVLYEISAEVIASTRTYRPNLGILRRSISPRPWLDLLWLNTYSTRSVEHPF